MLTREGKPQAHIRNPLDKYDMSQPIPQLTDSMKYRAALTVAELSDSVSAAAEILDMLDLKGVSK